MSADPEHDSAGASQAPTRPRPRSRTPRARLQAVSLVSTDPNLHLVVDRRPIRAREVVGSVHWFDVPARPRRIRIASRSCVPLTIGNGPDLRRLGVPIRRILLRTANAEITVDGEAPQLADGFTDSPDHIRWTDGDAGLPFAFFAWLATPFEVGIELWSFPVAYPRRRRHALVVDTTTPVVERDHEPGANVLLWQMRVLQEIGFTVSFVPQRDFAFAAGRTTMLQERGINTILQPRYRSIASFLRDHARMFDLIYIHRAAVAERCMPALREHAPDVALILDGTDLRFPRLLREAADRAAADSGAADSGTSGNGAENLDASAEAIRAREFAMLAHVDCLLLGDAADREAIAAAQPALRLDRFPWLIEPRADVPGYAGRRDVLYVGDLAHPAAAASVRWLVEEVLPALRARMRQPETRLHIHGPGITPDLEALADEDVVICGDAGDLAARFDRHLALLAPAVPSSDAAAPPGPHAGPYAGPHGGPGPHAGPDPMAQRALAMALAHGLPVIAAPASVAAISLDRDHGMIADDAVAFAEAVGRLESDADGWTRLSAASREHIVAAFSLAQARRWFAGLLTGMGRADLLEPE